MLQDLTFGRLENEFAVKAPASDDILICVRDNHVLIRRHEDDSLELPTVGQVNTALWEHWDEEPYRYIFKMQGKNYFLWMGEAGDCPDFAYEDMRSLRQMQSKEVCFAVMTARHLSVWYRSNRFCGRCGTPTVHDHKERMLLCPHCGNMIFPKISPAVIVAVTDGDRLLLSKYAGRAYARYALIAGYTEIGETLEQTVQREVMEEVGLKVKNIRYYKSQPWGVDGNVLMGFYCDLDGDDTIRLDETELALAQWHHRHALPAKDDGISLTREMIRVFEEGREPR
ncbi:MAG: NAD(+) diphosphatase [Oscillospiraceae bacterium]|nr:NAD(+) diphosphatase [Oscillospiraceae bacterium]